MNIHNDTNGRPIRIATYFPRNYIGLEWTAKARYKFFGRRLMPLAAAAKQMEASWAGPDALAKQFIVGFDWNTVGIFRLSRGAGGAAGSDNEQWSILHPSGLKVAPLGSACWYALRVGGANTLGSAPRLSSNDLYLVLLVVGSAVKGRARCEALGFATVSAHTWL